MESDHLQNFKKINSIIENDKKDSTYKFALLRGVIDISQIDYCQHRRNLDHKERVFFPIGLLIDRWLVYYYPFIENSIPQRKGGESLHDKSDIHSKIAFRDPFEQVIQYYKNKNMGFVDFYRDYQTNKIPDQISTDFRNLINKLIETITDQPMRYLGKSQNKNCEYSIFSCENPKKINKSSQLSQEFIIENCGDFSYPIDVYEIFQYLGLLISGERSIINQWADFTVRADKSKKTDKEVVITYLTQQNGTERNTKDAKKIFVDAMNTHGNLKCVWSDEKITDNSFVIDHLIPLVVSKNNDLWNLLPAKTRVNQNKKDKIPFDDFLKERKELIFNCWDHSRKKYPVRFDKEVQFSLIGKNTLSENWHDQILDQIKKRCKYYISEQGREGWRWGK